MSYTNFNSQPQAFFAHYVTELSRYRHLALSLVGADLRSRFRRSTLGILWAVVQPLGFSLIIAIVWSQVFKAQSFMAFTVYVYSGMLVWEYLSQCVVIGLDSLINSAGYLKQARIPFFIFQLRVPLSGIVIAGFGLIGLLGLMIAAGEFPVLGIHLLLLPVFAVMLFLFAVPLGIISSIVGPLFRDARYVIGLALQAIFFLSPVMLDRAVLHSESLWLLQFINPLIAILDLFRAPLLYGKTWALQDFAIWGAWAGGLWIIALVTMMRAGRKIIFAL